MVSRSLFVTVFIYVFFIYVFRGVYDLHLAYSNYNQPTSQSASKWIPVDPTMALPDYIVRHRIPLTFEPRSEWIIIESYKRLHVQDGFWD